MVNKKKVPELRFKGFSDDWEQRKLKDLVSPVVREVPKPNIPYNRLSVRSHAKGTFHQKVEDPKTVAMDKLYVVKKNDLIVNITFAWEHAIAVAKKDDDGLLVSHRFPTFLIDKSDVNFIHYVVSQESFRRKMDLISPGGAGRNRVLNKKDFINLTIVVPKTIEEQERIGNFLKKLDNALALLQKKLDQYQALKKAFLQLMFPQNGESVPQVRFAHFSSQWDQRKLDQLVDRVKSYSLSRDVETNDYTGYKYVHYGDIHTKIADRINENSKLPNIKKGNYVFLEKGDLILADASEDYQGIATPAIVTIDTPYKLVSGLHTIALRPKNVDSLFLYYLIHSPIFRKYGYRTGTGMKVFGISVSNLLKFESYFPLVENQIKISRFLKNFDEIINFYQLKIRQFQLLKKVLLQKMFV